MSLRTSSLALAGLLALTALARAEGQLRDIPAEVGRAACERLAPKSLFVVWVSHLPISHPTLYRVVSVSVLRLPGPEERVRLEVTAQRVAISSRRDQGEEGLPHRFERADDEQVQRVIDLAYAYVPSAELPNTYVSLGKSLRLPCRVDHPAVELPADLLAAGLVPGPKPGEGINQRLGEPPSRRAAFQVTRTGTVKLHADGATLVLVDRHESLIVLRTWSDPALEEALRGRLGEVVRLRGSLHGGCMDQVELVE